MTKRDRKFIDMLCKLATDVKPVGAARIAAAIVYKNDVISFGVNRYKTHPFQKKFGRNSDSIYLHAETDAIHNALRRVDVDVLQRSTMYIARMKKRKTTDGNFEWVTGNVCPCEGCQRAIAEFGISRVFFTGEDGKIECL